IIYYVERNPVYEARVDTVFDHIDAGNPSAVTTPITLAESLIHPIRNGLVMAQQDFTDLITAGKNVTFVSLDQAVAQQAAALRVRYTLELDDACQVAAAFAAGCDGFLTNDRTLQRVQGITILVLDDLQP